MQLLMLQEVWERLKIEIKQAKKENKSKDYINGIKKAIDLIIEQIEAQGY